MIPTDDKKTYLGKIHYYFISIGSFRTPRPAKGLASHRWSLCRGWCAASATGEVRRS